MEKLEQYKLFVRTHKFDIAIFTLRFVLAFIFVAHAAIKIAYVDDTFDTFVAYGAPGIFGLILALIELITGIMMLAGFVVEVAAVAQALIALGSIYVVHGSRGFFIENGGYEYALLILAASTAIGLLGPGKIVLAKRYARTARSLREGGVDAESHPLGT
ncbi:MAG TPA: DoxX family protein [Candidatus Paceibacterota bacterium]|nr:DoxX family protein [Candidatus Paceibacterota bacterium]